MDPKPLKTPDITPAQLLAMVATIVGLLVSQGVIDNNRAQVITSIASIAIPIILVIADAIIRHGRARAFSLPPKGVVADDEPTASHGRARAGA